jgi:hypothetical protein
VSQRIDRGVRRIISGGDGVGLGGGSRGGGETECGPWARSMETNGDGQQQLNRMTQRSNSYAAFWYPTKFASLGLGFSHLWKKNVQQPVMAMIQSPGNVYSRGKIWSCECVGCNRGLQCKRGWRGGECSVQCSSMGQPPLLVVARFRSSPVAAAAKAGRLARRLDCESCPPELVVHVMLDSPSSASRLGMSLRLVLWPKT